LEALAEHRSSVLGLIPGQLQPSQKQFDTRVWNALRGFDPARVVWAESESKKVGNVSVPDALMTALRASPCARLELPIEERVQLLMEDYDFFVKDPAFFCARLDVLKDLRGKAVIDDWKLRVHAGQTEGVVRELLELHYDPGYATSTRRNYQQFDAGYVIAAHARTALSSRDFCLQALADITG
jgi:tRNA 2-selenouridine synthase